MAKKRKAGPRTKSGRLSRAHKSPELRDHGPPEAQAKRKALVGANGDETLAATASGMLLAHGYLEREEYDEAMEYRRLYSIQFGLPWPNASPANDLSEDYLVRIKERFRRMTEMLTPEQEAVIKAVCVFDHRPTWFFAERLGLKLLHEDHDEKERLLQGLRALVRGKPIANRRRRMIKAEVFTCIGAP